MPDNPVSESSTPLDVNSAASLLATQFGEAPPVEPATAEQEQSHEDAAVEALKAEQEQSEPESVEESEQPQKFTVKIDGKDVEVTLDELRNGYQRQADYTRKTMEISEARKAAEAEFNQARQERQVYAQQLQTYQQQLAQALGEQQNINWQQLLESDPVEYLKQQHLYNQRQAAFQSAQQEQARVWQQQQAEQATHIQKFVSEQQEALLAKLPEWKDEARAKADKEELKNFLRENAFNDNEIGNVLDHRQIVIARKAMMYDRLMSKAQAASKKVQTLPPKVERPGVTQTGNADQRTAAMKRLSKSGRVEDAASVFSQFL